MIRWRALIIGAVISGVCLYLLLSRVDLGLTWRALQQADPMWLLACFGTLVVALLGRCWRWQLLFLPADRVSFVGAVSSTLIGYMFNTVLPGRVGELARAALIARTDHVKVARALGTILVEKILDVMTLLVIFALLTVIVPLPPWIVAAGTTGAIVFGGATVVLGALMVTRRRFVAWLEANVDPLPILRRLKPSQVAEAVLNSANGLREPRMLALQVVLSALMWGVALLTVVTVLKAFRLDVPLAAAALVLVTTNLGMTVPSAPGYVGVYHAIAVGTLAVFGVAESEALGVAIALHALAFGSFTIFGALFLLEGTSTRRYEMSDLWSTRR